MRGEGPVVFVGTATLDTAALVTRFPEPDERLVAEDVVQAGGGPAATAAVAAARLGIPAAFVGVVGEDDEGTRILDGLAAEGVDVDDVLRRPGIRSGASVIIVDRSRGSRAICTRPVPPPTIPTDSAAAGALQSATWVHVDHHGWPAVSRLLANADKATGRHGGPVAPRRVSVDGGNPIPGFRPTGVDLYVPTLAELARIYGSGSDSGSGLGSGAGADSGRGSEADAGGPSPQRLVDAAVQDGARCVVATRGADGALAATAEGERCAVPGYPVEAVSTLGAGDVFHGALIAAAVRDMPLADSLRYATVAAALSCRALDGRSAAPRHEEVMRHLGFPQ